jgi:hypothetical protein
MNRVIRLFDQRVPGVAQQRSGGEIGLQDLPLLADGAIAHRHKSITWFETFLAAATFRLLSLILRRDPPVWPPDSCVIRSISLNGSVKTCFNRIDAHVADFRDVFKLNRQTVKIDADRIRSLFGF